MDAENIKIFEQVKAASTTLAAIDDDTKNKVLLAVADAIADNAHALLDANANDLERMDKANPLYDRLMLTPERLEGIAADMRHVATLPSPLGHTLSLRHVLTLASMCSRFVSRAATPVCSRAARMPTAAIEPSSTSFIRCCASKE